MSVSKAFGYTVVAAVYGVIGYSLWQMDDSSTAIAIGLILLVSYQAQKQHEETMKRLDVIIRRITALEDVSREARGYAFSAEYKIDWVQELLEKRQK